MNSRYFKQFLCMVLAAILIAISSIVWASPVQADDFNCYERGNSGKCSEPLLATSCNQPTNSKFRCCEGVDEDYHIVPPRDRNSDVTVLGIHGGHIEPYTSQISQELADIYKWNYYIFSGHGRKQCLKGLEGSNEEKNFKRLHITSTNFNHKIALDLVAAHPKSVSIHGYNPELRKYDKGVICVGGKNKKQINAFIEHVNANSSTFTNSDGYGLNPIDATDPEKKLCIDLEGTRKCNIVNRNCKGKGLQLELSYGMRMDLANKNEVRFNTLRSIIYGAIKEAMDIESSSCSEDRATKLTNCR